MVKIKYIKATCPSLLNNCNKSFYKSSADILPVSELYHIIINNVAFEDLPMYNKFLAGQKERFIIYRTLSPFTLPLI